MPLMIVESPTKIKTLARHLDGDWDFAVTAGHLFDLPEDRMGINDDYDPEWVQMSSGTIEQIRDAATANDSVYLASDPDREGEAIAWQVENLVLNGSKTHRIRLESITKTEINDRVNDPDTTNIDMVQAQWARRLLDRLAGYKISPFLMNAFKGKKLSAGRVQSAVLAKIVERYEAHEDFEPETFYRICADVVTPSGELDEPITVELSQLDDRDIGTDDNKSLLTDADQAETIRASTEEHGFRILQRESGQSRMNPSYPFDNSEMLRRASSWFGWSSGKTMNVAQSLYEKGLITYHRSDSNRLSRDACASAASFIKEEYGSEFHQWRGGGAGDQEGHEAIRAKNPHITPEDLHSVSRNEYTLYSAIWQRYIQSQMKAAVWNTLDIYLTTDEPDIDVVFTGSIRSIEEWGFFRCSRSDETPLPEKERSESDLKIASSTDTFTVDELEIRDSETTGPRLFTEGSLIAMMKREGIGRPSTYSSTIKKLRSREYIKNDSKNIVPTQRGLDVCHFLVRAIPAICDVELTEEMETDLDEIAKGHEDWKSFVRSFDSRLDEWIEDGADVEPEGSAEGYSEPLGYSECPRCEGDLIQRKGQYGKFVHCESDECDFSSNPPAKTYTCPECDRHMVKRKGNRSSVYHCIAHPECEGKRPVGKPNVSYSEFQEDAPDCPECGETMDRRKGRYGYFWGCPEYPDCEGTRQIDD